ncbi:hypothetical protein HWV62_42538 [Athelia sp. TMB]|nr:hypothetical protein HWV62_42538 [Athelia sp. TMB]
MTITLNFNDPAADSSTRRILTDISLSVAKSKKIVVVTGAGISCSCGIPDFRSSDGLYNLVKQQYPDVVLKGRDLFDASLFRDPTSTSVFYTFISQLKRSIDAAAPAPTHRFIKTLDTKNKLLRSYTQNIDGLEARAGLLGSASEGAKAMGKAKGKIRTKDVKNVQLHGDIHRVRCTFCSADFACEEVHMKMFNEGTAPDCPECCVRSEARVARSARSLKIGTLRPAIVLYDEPHPLGDDIGIIQTADVNRKPDMLIIMGTSLKVHGLKKLVKDFAKAVHASAPAGSPKGKKAWAGKVVFVNRTPPAGEWADIIDYHVAGETDAWVEKVLEDWRKMRPADWEVQQTLTSVNGEVSPFRVINKNIPVVKAKVTKKPKSAENVPLPPSAPSSPSKRRGSTEHYCSSESSPSKKRLSAATNVLENIHLEASERGLLFGQNSTNIQKSATGSRPAVPTKTKTTAGSRRAKAAVAAESIKPAAMDVDFWVEIPA